MNELKFLAGHPQVIDAVVERATKDQREKVRELSTTKRSLEDALLSVDRKAKHLLDVLGADGSKRDGASYIMKELDELDRQSRQLRAEIETAEFEANDLGNRIVSADLIRENFRVFRDVYDQLTPDEKFDLLHLLIRRIVYTEEAERGAKGERRGKIKMDLWELPPIDPSQLNSADQSGFAESRVWLPE